MSVSAHAPLGPASIAACQTAAAHAPTHVCIRARLLLLLLLCRRYAGMGLPREGDTAHSLRRRFPHFPEPLMQMLEACLQVGSGGQGVGGRRSG